MKGWERKARRAATPETEKNKMENGSQSEGLELMLVSAWNIHMRGALTGSNSSYRMLKRISTGMFEGPERGHKMKLKTKNNHCKNRKRTTETHKTKCRRRRGHEKERTMKGGEGEGRNMKQRQVKRGKGMAIMKGRGKNRPERKMVFKNEPFERSTCLTLAGHPY
jgi:hypothetical protein